MREAPSWYIRLVAIPVLIGLSSCKIRVIWQRWRKKIQIWAEWDVLSTLCKKFFPASAGSKPWWWPAILWAWHLGGWNQEMCCQQICQVACVYRGLPGKDALNSSYGTASFPPTPLHVTGLALNAAYEYLCREGSKKIYNKPNSSTAITLQWSERCQCGLQPLSSPLQSSSKTRTQTTGDRVSMLSFSSLLGQIL